MSEYMMCRKTENGYEPVIDLAGNGPTISKMLGWSVGKSDDEEHGEYAVSMFFDDRQIAINWLDFFIDQKPDKNDLKTDLTQPALTQPAPPVSDDAAAMNIDPNPPGVMPRKFTPEEIAAMDREPPVSGPVTGETSDGYHTFNELYDHRHTLFIALLKCYPDKAWRAWEHSDGSRMEGWFIAGIETPEGQATYHLPERLWHDTVAKFKNRAPKWDGHTSDDVLKRIAAIKPVARDEKTEPWPLAHDPDQQGLLSGSGRRG